MVSKQAAIVLLLLTQKLPAAGRGERDRGGERERGREAERERQNRRIKNFKFAAIPATKAICIINNSRLQRLLTLSGLKARGFLLHGE
jgi:hypothetical protein